MAVPTEIVRQYSLNQIMLNIAPYTMVATSVGILLSAMRKVTVLEAAIKKGAEI